jgi:hypothetical protein
MAIPKGYKGSKRQEIDIVPVVEEVKDTLLSAEEMAEIEADVLAEIEGQERERLKKVYKDQAKEKLRRAKGLAEEQITLVIDLPGHSKEIRLDGVIYSHGHQFTVPKSVADSLYDVMGRAWDHEEQVGGANQNEYRKPRSTRVSGATGAITNAPVSNSAAIPAAPQGPQTAIPQESISSLSAARVGPKVTTSRNLHSGTT